MLILSKAVFLMAPRTGSTWARQALRSAGVRYKEWGPKHSLNPWRPDNLGGTPGFKFTFVREPAAWVRSRWTLGPWEDSLQTVWSPDPDEFSASVTPAMVQMYFAPFVQLSSFVGQTETLADDLVSVLRQVGESFNERDLRNTPRTNQSHSRLDLGAFYEMMPEQWARLPVEDVLRMPSDLLRDLFPQGEPVGSLSESLAAAAETILSRLTVPQTRQLLARLANEAVPRRSKDLPIRVGSD